MLAHFFGKSTQADTCKVVDGEASVFRIVQWEHSGAQSLYLWVCKAFFESGQAHAFRDLLHHDLHENAT
jgi:hypothetical protein